MSNRHNPSPFETNKFSVFPKPQGLCRTGRTGPPTGADNHRKTMKIFSPAPLGPRPLPPPRRKHIQEVGGKRMAGRGTFSPFIANTARPQTPPRVFFRESTPAFKSETFLCPPRNGSLIFLADFPPFPGVTLSPGPPGPWPPPVSPRAKRPPWSRAWGSQIDGPNCLPGWAPSGPTRVTWPRAKGKILTTSSWCEFRPAKLTPFPIRRKIWREKEVSAPLLESPTNGLPPLSFSAKKKKHPAQQKKTPDRKALLGVP